MSAYAKFFCVNCQRERPLEEKLKVARNVTKCRACAEKKRPVGRKARVSDLDSYDSIEIPGSVMDAYREAME